MPRPSLCTGVTKRWLAIKIGNAVTLSSSGTLLGDVALRTGLDDVGHTEAELGFTFASAHQGQGYATEAVRAVVQYAFQQLAVHRVFSRTDARNLRAQRLLERVGFRREGEFEDSTWFKGAWVTDMLYTQLDFEWRSAPSGRFRDTTHLKAADDKA